MWVCFCKECRFFLILCPKSQRLPAWTPAKRIAALMPLTNGSHPVKTPKAKYLENPIFSTRQHSRTPPLNLLTPLSGNHVFASPSSKNTKYFSNRQFVFWRKLETSLQIICDNQITKSEFISLLHCLH